MPDSVHAFDYLAAKPDEYPPASVCVLFGDEPLLQRLSLRRLRDQVLGNDAQDVPYTTFEGEETEWRDVHDELATVSLFGRGRRLAVVDNADEFVRRYRDSLEQYVAKPARASVLVLRVGSWPANTRIYKAVRKTGCQIDCRLPQRKSGRKPVLDETKLGRWLVHRAQSEHGVRISREGVQLLFELVGTELGLLDQELAKLALYVDKGGRATPELVRDVSCSWRTKSTWDIVDHAADGNACEALTQLDKLLTSGEKPQALFGSFSWSLRRYAAATRIYEQEEREGYRGTPKDALRNALLQAKFQSWSGALQEAENRLRQLGRERAGLLYRWLLEADLAMKLTHSQDERARLVLERLFIRMCKQAILDDASTGQ